MSHKTAAEKLFESFCKLNGISWARVPASPGRTPDYSLDIGGREIFVEVKEIDADGSDTADQTSSSTVGAHVRRKISDARKQAQARSLAGAPCVLLVHNNLDPFQTFGTEPHDFLAAMYGETTFQVRKGELGESYYGRNASLGEEKNTSFSAIGHLRSSPTGPHVKLFENAYARHALDFQALPGSIEFVRVEVEGNAARR